MYFYTFIIIIISFGTLSNSTTNSNFSQVKVKYCLRVSTSPWNGNFTVYRIKQIRNLTWKSQQEKKNTCKIWWITCIFLQEHKKLNTCIQQIQALQNYMYDVAKF